VQMPSVLRSVGASPLILITGFSQPATPARSLLEQAHAGEAEAQHELGNEIQRGPTASLNEQEAAKWFRKAAEQGHACACFDLGMCYATGSGVPTNPVLAVAWFQKAADKGHVEAFLNLGIAYHEGMGVPKDLSKATKCFLQAAAAGHPSAMLNLGIAYAKGEGIPRDRAVALDWFLRCEAASEPKAKEWIAFLRKEGFGAPPVPEGNGIIHGENHAYFIQAPKGWGLDNAIWADRGIFAVFYPVGKTFQESPVIGYSMIQTKGQGDLATHIQADMAYSLKNAKDAKTERIKSLKTKDGMTAIVYAITGVPNQNPEWLAYIDAPTVIILVSVSVRKEENFQTGKGLLEDLVASISWFTNKVQYPKP